MNIDEQRKAFEKYELSKKPEGNPKLMFQRFEVEDLGIDEQSYVGKYYNSFMEEKWELWLASANQDGYKLVPVSFLKDINSVAVDEFHKWKIKEEQMPAICEYMQDLSFYIGVEK